MCELFGFCSAKQKDIRDYLKVFYGHSIHHPHGWGFMRENDSEYEIFKETVRAADSDILSCIVSSTKPQKNTLAHIRLATVGAIKKENCHPYTGSDNMGRKWTLIHNGTIYSSKLLTKYLSQQSGDTDSERVFLYLLDEINKAVSEKQGGNLSAKERFEIIDKLVVSLSPRNKLNLMIFDGEVLYVHKNMKDTLYFKQDRNSTLFSTLPLDDGEWKPYPMAQLCAFENGKKVFEGTKHNGVFVPNLEYINALAAMNI